MIDEINGKQITTTTSNNNSNGNEEDDTNNSLALLCGTHKYIQDIQNSVVEKGYIFRHKVIFLEVEVRVCKPMRF